MDPQAAVRRLLELHKGEFDPAALDEYLDDTALQLVTAICTCMSFAAAGVRGTRSQNDVARIQLQQCVGALNMVFEVWDMAGVEIVDEPYLDEYALGWAWVN